jgi:hypothetical protein
MDNKPSARQKPAASSPEAPASAAEKKLREIGQRLKAHPSIAVGALVIGYCAFRFIFKV